MENVPIDDAPWWTRSKETMEAYDEGFAQGRAATLTITAAELAEQAIREGQAGNVRAANVLDSYALTLSCANAENAERAAIRAGEVRG